MSGRLALLLFVGALVLITVGGGWGRFPWRHLGWVLLIAAGVGLATGLLTRRLPLQRRIDLMHRMNPRMAQRFFPRGEEQSRRGRERL